MNKLWGERERSIEEISRIEALMYEKVGPLENRQASICCPHFETYAQDNNSKRGEHSDAGAKTKEESLDDQSSG